MNRLDNNNVTVLYDGEVRTKKDSDRDLVKGVLALVLSIGLMFLLLKAAIVLGDRLESVTQYYKEISLLIVMAFMTLYMMGMALLWGHILYGDCDARMRSSALDLFIDYSTTAGWVDGELCLIKDGNYKYEKKIQPLEECLKEYFPNVELSADKNVGGHVKLDIVAEFAAGKTTAIVTNVA